MNPGEISDFEPRPGHRYKVKVLVPMGGHPVAGSDVFAVFLRLDTNTRTIWYRNDVIREGLPA